MLDAICGELRNYFVKNVYKGTITIENGSMTPSDFLQNGQYFRIVGSVFNDGVHQYPNNMLADEVFGGEVWAMAIPPALIALSEQIKDYVDTEANVPSPYTSESFGGYSYTRATGENGAPITWQKVFSKQLNRWRKI